MLVPLQFAQLEHNSDVLCSCSHFNNSFTKSGRLVSIDIRPANPKRRNPDKQNRQTCESHRANALVEADVFLALRLVLTRIGTALEHLCSTEHSLPACSAGAVKSIHLHPEKRRHHCFICKANRQAWHGKASRRHARGSA